LTTKYRPDIDGLRAIAVIPVVLFHANFLFFSGGYVGVDIFFVISGYLITNILLNDINDNQFSIVTFYERRVRRIFPALFAVLIATSIVALVIMLPTELDSYGRSLFSSTFFYSNYHFMFDADYFSAPAETKPLLHMWSLAVEEQFYIFFPVYLYFVSKYAKKALGLITILAIITSFIYSLLLINTAPSDAFYSAPARAWELLIGSLLAIYPARHNLKSSAANILGITGLSLITYAIFFYNKQTQFPGINAILPVAGTALIIYSGSTTNSLTRKILSISPLIKVGLISFSLYLWHWPIMVFYNMYSIAPPAATEIMSLLLITLAVSYASWRFIETPFRKRRVLAKRKNIFVIGGIVMACSAVLGLMLALTNGLPSRFSSEIITILASETDNSNDLKCQKINTETVSNLKVCEFGDKTADHASFAVWGDSHGKAIIPGIELAAKKFNQRGVFIGRGGCLTLLEAHQVRQGYDTCVNIADSFISYLSEHPEIQQVMLVSRWALYAMGERFKHEKGSTILIKDNDTQTTSLSENKEVFKRSLKRTFDKLNQLGRQIVFVSQVPETEFSIPTATARAILFNKNIELRPKFSEYKDRQEFVTGLVKGLESKYSIKIVSPKLKMCNGDYCQVLDNQTPIYRDSNHISTSYALKLSDIFDSAISEIN